VTPGAAFQVDGPTRVGLCLGEDPAGRRLADEPEAEGARQEESGRLAEADR
jgi:hypothetical protein